MSKGLAIDDSVQYLSTTSVILCHVVRCVTGGFSFQQLCCIRVVNRLKLDTFSMNIWTANCLGGYIILYCRDLSSDTGVSISDKLNLMVV
jgi:hypothetical protein